MLDNHSIFFMGLFIFWGGFSARRVNRACVIILDGYPHFHLLVLYITCFVIFPLHFPVLSIQCFMFFSLSSSLYYHSLSLSLFSLSLCCCELTFPCAAGVVVPRSERELLRKHLRLPTSLWLCSFPIFATGPFEVMNEKWQYLKPWPIRNRLVRAIHKQLETSCKYWSAGAPSVFLLLWSKALIQNQHPLGRTTPGFYFLYLFDLKLFDSDMIEVPNLGHSYIQSTFPNATGLTSDLVVLGRRRT